PMSPENPPGAAYLGEGKTGFRVWAPVSGAVSVHIIEPRERTLPLEKSENGYFTGVIDDVPPGSLYRYVLDGKQEFPDPASCSQPQGVHGPSQVMTPDFPWEDAGWPGIELHDYIIYELHVGTFTPEGTFDAVIGHLDELKALSITAVELMPVNQFPGGRNWGYDGVFLYAAQDSYGGPDGLRRLVDACHKAGLAVVLDVVYNHLGPEGNCLGSYGPYFTDRYHTPWGAALNFDGADSDEVRRFFIENALYWVTDCHIDGLRLDALHAILDISSYTFIEELAAAVHRRAEKLKRNIYLFGESSANNARLIKSVEEGGYGLDAQWNDDFHHAVHTLLTGEATGYYQDYGEIRHLVKAFREGFAYSGEYSPYRRHRHGTSSRDIPAQRFVVFSQNHDQVGNRARSERLGQLVSFEALKLAAGLVFLSPYLPLIFMGEEYGETAPFPYFISHSDPALIEAVRKGRRAEFTAFKWQGEILDPQDEATFRQAKLDRGLNGEEKHRVLREFYGELIRLRKENAALARPTKDNLEVRGDEKNRTLFVRRRVDDTGVFILYNIGNTRKKVNYKIPAGRWRRILDSSEGRWLGEGGNAPDVITASGGEVAITLGPESLVLFQKEN
ncbi:MAG: malto-oligosyltrehalose trehalohydrolase, partial [Chloroflexota bacterium]